jgi:group I intron endonuclease
MEITRKKYFNTSGIYCFLNKINGKRYIGLANSIYKRFKQHLRGESGSPKFENALKKYGINNFEFSILEECLPEFLSDKEEYWIVFYNTTNDNCGYNIIQRQDKPRTPHTEKTKLKIKNSLKIAFPHGRKAENNPFYNRKHSQETLAVMSEIATGRVSPNRKPVIAYNETETREFASLSIAAESVNGHREIIWKKIKNNRKYKGYFWKYVTFAKIK